MRFLVGIAVLIGTGTGSVMKPESLKDFQVDHGTRIDCMRPSGLTTTADQRREYVQCLAGFIREQQWAVDEHTKAAAQAAVKIHDFVSDLQITNGRPY